MSIESEWVHTTTDVPEQGLEIRRSVSGAEALALAETLEVVAVERLEVRYRIKPARGGTFKLSGEIYARVVQACVVTLDPVIADIREPLEAEFRPVTAMPVPDGAEREVLSVPEIEPIEHHRIAVGRVIVEALAAALDPYPRVPGAELDLPDDAAGPAADGPFAALAGLKPKIT